MLITRHQLQYRTINQVFRVASSMRGGKGYTIYACEPTADESRNDLRRDYITCVIFKAGETRGLVLPIGSPIIHTQDHPWNEAAAARSAISFASAPWCADDANEKQWMEDNGDDLNNAAYNHRVLGSELRES